VLGTGPASSAKTNNFTFTGRKWGKGEIEGEIKERESL
jgi:hypothetical protein